MKIRTDFVTNSSSSNFTLSLEITMKDENVIHWIAEADGGEGDADYGEITVLRGPKSFAKAESISQLIDMLNRSFKNNYIDKNDQGSEILVGDMIGNKLDDYEMSDIKSISISGEEVNYMTYYQKYTFVTESQEYLEEIDGEPFEKDGSSGGEFLFAENGELPYSENPEFEQDWLFDEEGAHKYSPFWMSEHEEGYGLKEIEYLTALFSTYSDKEIRILYDVMNEEFGTDMSRLSKADPDRRRTAETYFDAFMLDGGDWIFGDDYLRKYKGTAEEFEMFKKYTKNDIDSILEEHANY